MPIINASAPVQTANRLPKHCDYQFPRCFAKLFCSPLPASVQRLMTVFMRSIKLILLVAAIGCGAKSSGPVTYPVTGKVTLAGSPVEDAAVRFVPDSPDLGISGATAQTQSDGSFNVMIEFDMGRSSKEGLPAGDYRVSIIKVEHPAGAPSLSKPPQNTLPPKYAAVESTPLTATVRPEGENHFEFPL